MTILLFLETAACSSSLVALNDAVHDLQSGHIDFAMVGGASGLFRYCPHQPRSPWVDTKKLLLCIREWHMGRRSLMPPQSCGTFRGQALEFNGHGEAQHAFPGWGVQVV